MKTLVLYYSYSGHTKKLAEVLAQRESADIAEITDKKRPSALIAFTRGCLRAIRGKAWRIMPLGVELSKYDHIILMSAIWAGNPPPAVNAVLANFPEGKTVDIKMVSGGGKSRCKDKLSAIISEKGCVLGSYEDIKG